MAKRILAGKIIRAMEAGNSICLRCGAERTARAALYEKMRPRRKPEPKFSVAGCAIAASALLTLWVLTNLLPFGAGDAIEALHIGAAVLAGSVLLGGYGKEVRHGN